MVLCSWFVPTATMQTSTSSSTMQMFTTYLSLGKTYLYYLFHCYNACMFLEGRALVFFNFYIHFIRCKCKLVLCCWFTYPDRVIALLKFAFGHICIIAEFISNLLWILHGIYLNRSFCTSSVLSHTKMSICSLIWIFYLYLLDVTMGSISIRPELTFPSSALRMNFIHGHSQR